MTQEQHPITPPDDLIQRWLVDAVSLKSASETGTYVATQAARWGADQELKACCAGIHTLYGKCGADFLRVSRRPKPPSLKEQALELVDRIEKAESVWAMSELNTIRRALEALPD